MDGRMDGWMDGRDWGGEKGRGGEGRLARGLAVKLSPQPRASAASPGVFSANLGRIKALASRTYAPLIRL